MSLIPSLLQAVVNLDGEALVMHVGEKPYVISPTGQVDLSARGLSFDAVWGILTQLLPPESQSALEEVGAAQFEMQPLPGFEAERFTVVAARGGDDVWVELRRRRTFPDPATAAESLAAADPVGPPASTSAADRLAEPGPATAAAAVSAAQRLAAPEPGEPAAPVALFAAPPEPAAAAAPLFIPAPAAPVQATPPPPAVAPQPVAQKQAAPPSAPVSLEPAMVQAMEEEVEINLDDLSANVEPEPPAMSRLIAPPPAASAAPLPPVAAAPPTPPVHAPAPAVPAAAPQFTPAASQFTPPSPPLTLRPPPWAQPASPQASSVAAPIRVQTDKAAEQPDASWETIDLSASAGPSFDVAQTIELSTWTPPSEMPALTAEPPSSIPQSSSSAPIPHAPSWFGVEASNASTAAHRPELLPELVQAALPPPATPAARPAYSPQPIAQPAAVSRAEAPSPPIAPAVMPSSAVPAVAPISEPSIPSLTWQQAAAPPPVGAEPLIAAGPPSVTEPPLVVAAPERTSASAFAAAPTFAAAPPRVAEPLIAARPPSVPEPSLIAAADLFLPEAALVVAPPPVREAPVVAPEVASAPAIGAAPTPAPTPTIVPAPTIASAPVIVAASAIAPAPVLVPESPVSEAALFAVSPAVTASPVIAPPPSAQQTLAPPASPVIAAFPGARASAQSYTVASRDDAPLPQPAVVLPLTRNPIRPEAPAPLGEQALSTLDRLLRLAAARGANALYLSSNARPSMRVDGEMQVVDGLILGPNEVESLLMTLMPERNAEALRTGSATEWIIDLPELGRVRCMSFRDHRGPGGVFRMMPVRAVTAEQLALSREIQALAMEQEGLVIVAGPRSGGKRTLIAALIDLINRGRRDHVITIEREINIVHERVGSFVSQRESRAGLQDMFEVARAALREDPDVLVLEEVRSTALMNVALDAAAAGQLVIGGFPAHSASDAIDRIIDLYPPEQRRQVQLTLAQNLRGVVGQVLLRKSGGGRIAARELLLNTPAVASVLAEGKTSQLPLAIEGGRKHGMAPLNDSLVALVQSGIVGAGEAYRHASDRAGFIALLNRQGIDTSFARFA